PLAEEIHHDRALKLLFLPRLFRKPGWRAFEHHNEFPADVDIAELIDPRCLALDRVADEHDVAARTAVPDRRRECKIIAVRKCSVAERKARRRIDGRFRKTDLLKVTALVSKRL